MRRGAGGLPPELSLLTNLQKLDVSRNKCSGAVRAGIPRGSELRSESHVNGAGTLPMMPPSLKELNMYNAGKFTGGIPPEWSSLTSLETLDMRDCGLDGASYGQTTHTEGIK